MQKINVKACPNCGSICLRFYYHDGVDLKSNFIRNYFLECINCGTYIKSRNFLKLVEIWNNYEK